MDINSDGPGNRGKLTLAIDVGGTRLKAGLLDQNGVMVAGPNRVNTPAHPLPQVVVDAWWGWRVRWETSTGFRWASRGWFETGRC